MAPTRLIRLLAAMPLLSCASARMSLEADMIVPNEHSVSRGTRGILADIDECNTSAGVEKRRLLDEIYAFDPNIARDEARHARSKAAGAAIGEKWATPTDVRERANSTNKQKRAAIAGAVATDLVVDILSGGDDTPPDVQYLVREIDFFRTFTRLSYICLRRKGYQIDEYASDGTGTAYLEPYEHRVTLREKDCTGTVMYEYPEPEEGLGGPAPETDWCTPETVELAAAPAPPVAASGLVATAVAPLAVLPPSDLPDDFARIETRSGVDGYLEVEPECVESRSGFDVCTWRAIGKGQDAWEELAEKVDTGRRVNVVCELPLQGTIQTPQACEVFPRETLGKPDLDDAARDAAAARIDQLNGIAETSRLVGDGPVECDMAGDGSQRCRWFTNNQTQGFILVGAAADTRDPAELTCRFAENTGATVPGSCEARPSP